MIIINYIIIIIIKNGDFLTEDKSQRTSLAKDIVLAKDFLGIPIYDESREKAIHKKIRKLSEEKGLDADIIDQIIDMLTKLSKIEQNKILRRNVDGKY